MSVLTTNPMHPDLGRGINDEPVEQNKAYLVLSEEELSNGFIKPLRYSYKHLTCGTITTMDYTIAATYARNPWFYGATYCVNCQKHRPLIEFTWEPDGESMEPNEWNEAEHERIATLRKSDI
jgi:hypothetical protein